MVTPYATVSLFSRATWSWMNPLIAKGNKSTLQLDDVPCLTPEHHAEKLLHSFQSHQPSPAARSNHLVTTLPLSAPCVANAQFNLSATLFRELVCGFGVFDSTAVVIALSAVSQTCELKHGLVLHGMIAKKRLDFDGFFLQRPC